ncbi:hypothetical protein HDV63DRAFT_365995 [Trichoderma sp. SZMC 28014]
MSSIIFDAAACLSNACQSLDIKFNAMPLNPKRTNVAAAPSFAAPARLTTTSAV